MTTLTINQECVTHTPNKNAISTIYGLCFDEQFTFCEVCENNIERWVDIDNLYSPWSKWSISK